MPIFTTSRKPCARTRTLIKEIARVVPESETLPRGKQSIDDLAEKARSMGHSRVAVVTEMHGNPREIRVLGVSEADWEWAGKPVRLKSVKLAREFGERVRKPESIAAEGGSPFLDLLGVPASESDTFVEESPGSITFFQGGKEVGPRMVLA